MLYLVIQLLLGPVIAYAEPSSLFAGPELLRLERVPAGFEIETERGRKLHAIEAAWAFGDRTTQERATQLRRRHRNVGGALLATGPVLLIVGTAQVGQSSWRGGPYLEAVGGASLLMGTAALIGGLGLLFDQRPVRVSTYYSPEQAEELVDAFNRDAIRRWSSSEGLHPPPRRGLEMTVSPCISPFGAGAVVAGRW
ncbi:MAG: hypothetical protein EA397_08700 [Deltaproteobacteria bacterium]|nr:MAG: hypothetical protein EA397_08700 [Deltaproteobacteria bacterium]